MNRRNLLGMTAIGLGLAACQGASLPTLPVAVKIDIPQELLDGIAAITKLDGIQSLLPASVVSFIDKGKEIVAAITGAVSLDGMKTAGASLVSVLEQVVKFLPSSGTIGTIATAIQTLLPLIGQAVGLVSMFAARRPTGMSVAQARMVLRT